MLATRIRQKEGTFTFIAYTAAELLEKVRFTSRYFFEGEEIAQSRIAEHDVGAERRVGGQHEDAVVVVAETELARRAEHAFRRLAADLAALDREVAG